jgi:hypothetical protein
MSELQVGGAMPHFTVTRTDGTRVRYESIWQRKNLLLVLLPRKADSASEEYASQVADRSADITTEDAEYVVTRDPIAGAPTPGVVVADRWGEVHFIAGADDVSALPSPDDLVDWLRYVQVKCPECEGESR